AGAAALAATAGLNIQHQINFTRANEEEADRIGMQILERAGFDPRGMPAFFERLQQSSKYYQGNAPEFLRTHPLTDNRIADSRARAEEFEARHRPDSKSYLQTRAKIRVNSYEDPADAVKHFSRAMQETDGDIDHLRYGYALALGETGEYKRAGEHLKLLLKRDENNNAYMLALANLEKKRGNYATSLALFAEAYKYFPDYRPLILYYSKALLDANQPAEARKLLRRYGSMHDPDISYYNLLSQAEGQAGSQIESGIAKAEYYYLLGDTELAIKRLQLAKKEGTPDYYQKERIDARLAQLQYERELEKDLEL
ncbi:MAG: tetratricopeptide repeat protein, partial [Thiotrichales bacterium]|nr:tetratricopeptide repeat protein [Thiotrichales bacterium]